MWTWHAVVALAMTAGCAVDSDLPAAPRVTMTLAPRQFVGVGDDLVATVRLVAGTSVAAVEIQAQADLDARACVRLVSAGSRGARMWCSDDTPCSDGCTAEVPMPLVKLGERDYIEISAVGSVVAVHRAAVTLIPEPDTH